MLKSRTFVATPAYRGEVVMQYAHSLVRDSVHAMACGHFVEAPHSINNTYIHMARNDAVKQFIVGDWDYLMFIDADMGWEPGALFKMLDAPADMDVLGGVYRTKEDHIRFPFHPLPESDFLRFPVDEVGHVATGFMRITRACIERLMAAYPNGKLFNPIVDDSLSDGEWGDDFAFCKRARETGSRIFARFDIEFEHVGPKAWKGRASEDLVRDGQHEHDPLKAIREKLAGNPEFLKACEALGISSAA